MLSPRDNNPVFGVLLLGDKTSYIGVLSLVRDKVSINGVLSPGDNNPVFGVLLLGDKTSSIGVLSLVRDKVSINGVLSPEGLLLDQTFSSQRLSLNTWGVISWK